MSTAEDFAADLTAEAEAEQDWIDVHIAVNGKSRILRFTRLDGLAWGDICDRHPMREDVPLDHNYGYNLRSLTPAAAKVSGKLVDGGQLLELAPELWDKICASPAGKRIGDAVFNLNQWLPDMAVAAAKKASEVESAPNSSSPDNSESPAAD